MKKKSVVMISIIVALILLFPIPFRLKDGGSIEFKALLYTVTKYHKLAPIEDKDNGYIEGFGIKILGKEIYNSTENKDSKPIETNKTSSNGQVIISFKNINNIHLLDNFLDNTDEYNENKVDSSVEIVTYTIEGDPIFTTLQYFEQTNEIKVIRDNTKDRFASAEDRKVVEKLYSCSRYNLVKKINDDLICIMLEAEGDEELKDIIIFSYDKDLEKNKDTTRTKVKDVKLIAEETETSKLVKYNGILYGKSYVMIDYQGNPNGPIGRINKLIGEEYLPSLDGETNSEELLNSLVDDANEESMILIGNNGADLYIAIKEIKY